MSIHAAKFINSKVLIAGFATFAMFFGSGNLVFPLMMGREAQSNWFYSSLGLSVTGVIVPFLGLVALSFLKGSQDQFFRWFGKIGVWILPFLILLLIGPFGVVPRCITVGYGAWKTFSANTPLWLFSLICILIIYIATFGSSKIVDVIGKFFTPIKLGALALVIGGSLYFAINTQSIQQTQSVTSLQAFHTGFLEGYNTMDLMAALFFGVSLVLYFKSEKSDKVPLKSTISAMGLGMFILMVVYMALVYLGAAYAQEIKNLEGPLILPAIAHLALGSASDYLISFTLVVSCLTTAVALTAVSVDFICNKIAFFKAKKQLTLLLCLAVTFVLAMSGFTGIMSFIAPILMWLYPVLIILCLVNIFISYKKIKLEKLGLKNNSKNAA